MPVRRAGGHRVGVVEVHRLAVPGHVAGEARVVDRHRPLGEGELHGVVLRELEAEPLAVGPLLEEVEAPRFRPREPSGLGEDLLQEAVEVPFGGEGDPDPVQGGDALLGLGEPPGESRGRRAGGCDLRGGQENRREEGRRSVPGEDEAWKRALRRRAPPDEGGGGVRGEEAGKGVVPAFRREIERGSVTRRGGTVDRRPVVESRRAYGLVESIRQRLRRTVEGDALAHARILSVVAPAGSTQASMEREGAGKRKSRPEAGRSSLRADEGGEDEVGVHDEPLPRTRGVGVAEDGEVEVRAGGTSRRCRPRRSSARAPPCRRPSGRERSGRGGRSSRRTVPWRHAGR